MNNLEQCPWCHTANRLFIVEDEDEQCQVYCDLCGANGPIKKNKEDAVTAWNEK